MQKIAEIPAHKCVVDDADSACFAAALLNALLWLQARSGAPVVCRCARHCGAVRAARRQTSGEFAVHAFDFHIMRQTRRTADGSCMWTQGKEGCPLRLLLVLRGAAESADAAVAPEQPPAALVAGFCVADFARHSEWRQALHSAQLAGGALRQYKKVYLQVSARAPWEPLARCVNHALFSSLHERDRSTWSFPMQLPAQLVLWRHSRAGVAWGPARTTARLEASAPRKWRRRWRAAAPAIASAAAPADGRFVLTGALCYRRSGTSFHYIFVALTADEALLWDGARRRGFPKALGQYYVEKFGKMLFYTSAASAAANAAVVDQP